MCPGCMQTMQILSDMCFPDPYPMQGISLKGGSIFFIKSNFFSATGIFFHWFLLLKLWFFSYRGNQRIFVSGGRVPGFILSQRLGFVVPCEFFVLSDKINPCTLPRDTKILWFPRYERKQRRVKKFPAAEKKLQLMKKAKKNIQRLASFFTGSIFFFTFEKSRVYYIPTACEPRGECTQVVGM